jgi:hypothetical protein
MALRLVKRFLDPGASVNWVQAGHRRTAIEYAVEGARLVNKKNVSQFDGDEVFSELESMMPEWVIETIAQGAYMREYHILEKEVGEYFHRQLVANNQPLSVLKQKGGESFVSVVRRLVELFNLPELGEQVDQLDGVRERVNLAKHHPGVLVDHFVSIDDYWALLDAVEAFWEKLDGREVVAF